MEGTVSLDLAESLFGTHFIGARQICNISDNYQFLDKDGIEAKELPFQLEYLKTLKDTHILFYFHPYLSDKSVLTINAIKDFFGTNPDNSEPCFYNQDWYLKEVFANTNSINPGWYLLEKEVDNSTRGLSPENLSKQRFPPALLCTYLFFIFYLVRN